MIEIKKKHYDKWERLKEADKVLKEVGVSFEVKNQGLHYIIEDWLHYWPTSGKWRVPSTNETHTEETRFLSGLLKKLGIEYKVVIL